MKKRYLSLTAAAMMLTVFLAGCGGKQGETAGAAGTQAAGEVTAAAGTQAAGETTAAAGAQAAAESPAAGGSNVLTIDDPQGSGDLVDEDTAFLANPQYDGKVSNDEEAEAAVRALLPKIGIEEDTSLEPVYARPNEEGTVIYTFQQMAGEASVEGSIVKLAADAGGRVTGLTSSLIPGITEEKLSDWAVTVEEAEEIVRKEVEGTGAEIEKGASEKVLLPYLDNKYLFYCAYAVYTNNIYEEYETAYLVHYVDAEGSYLYCLPVAEPGDADVHSGEGTSLFFAGFEPDTWTGEVTLQDGSRKSLTVPVMKDKETGEICLGDISRKVICADCKDFEDEETISVRKQDKGRFADNELMIYDTFLRVYDTYASAGWKCPDDNGTPTLLLMDWRDKNGEPVNNACYAGRDHGYQTFKFNRKDPHGECTDVMAHEFAHCITWTLMSETLYYNCYGAINESFSDLCGNLVEELLGDTEDTTWLIGEHLETPYRCMSNPHLRENPAFAWDKWFVPETFTPNEINDAGGVHTNSSLLNLVGWRLREAGMPAEEQLYFWLNVSMAMTPRSDFSQLTRLMPWCMDRLGYEEYKEALLKAVDETGMADISVPAAPAEGLGIFSLQLPETEKQDQYSLLFSLQDPFEEETHIYDTYKEIGTGRAPCAVPEGSYVMWGRVFDENVEVTAFLVLTTEGWKLFGKEDGEAVLAGETDDKFLLLETDPGEVVQVETAGLEEAIKELEKALPDPAEE